MYAPGHDSLLNSLTGAPILTDLNPNQESVFRWATVVNTSPFAVRIDGDTVPLAATPDSLVSTTIFIPGDRVWVQLVNRRVLVLGRSTGTPSLASFMGRSGLLLRNGGTRRVTSSGVAWSSRFILIGAGQNALAQDGYFEILMPPDGTVIPFYSNASSTPVTVAGGLIPLAAGWQTLWYEIPSDGSYASDPANFRITHYQNSDVLPEVPDNWVFIAQRSSDAYPNLPIKWGDGNYQDYWRAPTLGSGWSNYAGGYVLTGYRLDNDGQVHLRGVIKSGVIGLPGLFTVPSGLEPDYEEIFAASSNGSTARLDIRGDGIVFVSGLGTGGTNAYLSLSGISWFPAGTGS